MKDIHFFSKYIDWKYVLELCTCLRDVQKIYTMKLKKHILRHSVVFKVGAQENKKIEKLCNALDAWCFLTNGIAIILPAIIFDWQFVKYLQHQTFPSSDPWAVIINKNNEWKGKKEIHYEISLACFSLVELGKLKTRKTHARTHTHTHTHTHTSSHTHTHTRPVARLFCGGGQIGQIWGPFMITRGLSCDRVEFGHFGGSDDPPDPPPSWLRAWTHTHTHTPSHTHI